ncbi:MAG TPA: SOS response-associated peptidase [Polyangia bacterium]|nr:SOS response-associated peptidase [Polyangia bacterium]
MCARTTLTRKRLRDVADELEAEFSEEDAKLYRPRYNAAPSETLWMLRAGAAGAASADNRALVPATWGYLAGGRALINVRGEQVGSGRGFREAFASRRCGVVCDGFFEWDRRHRPTWFHRSDGGLIVLGSLYQRPADAGHLPRFTILTTRPNRLVAAVHDRMPLILPPERLDGWLSDEPARVLDLLAPAPEAGWLATPVSTRVNRVRHDDPECLVPVEPAAQDRQCELF